MGRTADLQQAARFATRLYGQRAAVAWWGYARRDPVARLMLRQARIDPYPLYEELRALGPIARTRLGNWVVTSHPVVDRILRDKHVGVASADFAGDLMDLSILGLDPPDHTRLRRLAAPAFVPRRMEAFRGRIATITDALVDAALREGRVDLVSAIAAPLPIAVITDLLGVPDADAERFARYGTTIGSALDGVRSLRHGRELLVADRALTELFEDLLAVRRREPGDDLVSHLALAEGEQATARELVVLCRLLLVAGFETTVNLIGNAVHALLEHPDQWRLLRDDPSLAARAVEETLRYDSPVQRTARIARADLDLAGAHVRPGQWLITLLGAANRDPEVYPHPDRFDLLRENPAEHLSFSGGIHYCVGAPLARLEGEIALATLAERVDLQAAGRPVRRPGTTIRGLLHLPVRLRAHRPALR